MTYPAHDDSDGYPPPVHEPDPKPLPDDAQQRIEQAKEAARQRRRELGLPDLPPDELPPPSRGRRGGKRWKNHGQFVRQGSQ